MRSRTRRAQRAHALGEAGYPVSATAHLDEPPPDDVCVLLTTTPLDDAGVIVGSDLFVLQLVDTIPDLALRQTIARSGAHAFVVTPEDEADLAEEIAIVWRLHRDAILTMTPRERCAMRPELGHDSRDWDVGASPPRPDIHPARGVSRPSVHEPYTRAEQPRDTDVAPNLIVLRSPLHFSSCGTCHG